MRVDESARRACIFAIAGYHSPEMYIHRYTIVAFAGLAFALAGCASSARFLDRKTTGGVVAVPDYAHRDEGLALIEREIGPDYSIVDEAEVVTGADTKTIAESGTGSIFTRLGSWFTGTKQVGSTETKTVKSTEWRITYVHSPQQHTQFRPTNP